MNDGDLLFIELVHALVSIFNFDFSLNGEDVDAAPFHEQKLPFGWVSGIILIAHVYSLRCVVVLTSDDKEHWGRTRLLYDKRIMQSDAEFFGAACEARQQDEIRTFKVGIVFDLFFLHGLAPVQKIRS